MSLFVDFILDLLLLRKECLVQIVSLCENLCCEIKLLASFSPLSFLKYLQRLLGALIQSSLDGVEVATNKHGLESGLEGLFGG